MKQLWNTEVLVTGTIDVGQIVAASREEAIETARFYAAELITKAGRYSFEFDVHVREVEVDG